MEFKPSDRTLADSVSARICHEADTPICGPSRRSRLSANPQTSATGLSRWPARAAQAALEDVYGVADGHGCVSLEASGSMSINMISQMWPSTSSKLRPYMKPWSCKGFVRLAAVSGSGLNHAVDRRAVVGAQAQHDFAGSMGIDDGLLGERSPLRVGEQHHVDAVGDDHADGGVVAELRVVDGADCFAEGLGLLQVSDGQVDEFSWTFETFKVCVERESSGVGERRQQFVQKLHAGCEAVFLPRVALAWLPPLPSLGAGEQAIDTSYPAAPVSANCVSRHSGRRLTVAATESRQ